MNAPTQARVAIEMHGVDIGSMRDQALVVARGVNWTVKEREFWVVAGLQGAGKTDFLMMAAGLMPPTAGSYFFFGEQMPIFEEPRLEHRLRLGLVFDGGQPFNHLTIAENIALPLRYHRNFNKAQAHEAVQALLEQTGLAQWADSTPGAIGRNWLKRMGLARALILRPEVLLVDNPLGGLDPRHAQWWLRFFDELLAGTALGDNRPITLVVTASDLAPWQNPETEFALLHEREFRVLGRKPSVLKNLSALGDQAGILGELLAGGATVDQRGGI